jgi:N-acetylglucosaminyldiphosphoundecaprenol N-acetyl-beta-D-mannosaminyltransferase
MRTERRTFLDIDFDVATMSRLISEMGEVRPGSAYAYLVTPNVDHLVRLHGKGAEVAGLADVYRQADFCTCDSRVLARLAKWRGVTLPVVPGSDLAALMFEHVIAPGDRIAIVGGDGELLARLKSKFPGVDFVHHEPPMGLMRNPSARRRAAEFIAGQRPRFTFICVGSPQQELIASEAGRVEGSQGLALCVGAALEFITGTRKRAPRLARRLGLEWAHRLLTNPRRMWRRYLIEGPAIFLLAYRWRGSAA